MEGSHIAELKRLGVPFFGLKEYLLRADKNTEGGESSNEAVDGKITPKQLKDLQQRMLNHLVELYGD